MIYRKLTHIPQGNTYTITTRIPRTHTHARIGTKCVFIWEREREKIARPNRKWFLSHCLADRLSGKQFPPPGCTLLYKSRRSSDGRKSGINLKCL